jgi:sugar lactone lactonase YvrE
MGSPDTVPETAMKKLLQLLAVVALLPCAAVVRADPPREAFRPVSFAVLPDGVRYPEGIASNPANGDIFVGTFDFGPNHDALLRYDRHGRLVARIDMGVQPLLGLQFGPDGRLYILNAAALTGAGASRVQRIRADFSSGDQPSDLAVVPGIGAPAPRDVANPDGSHDTVTFGSSNAPAPNGLAFDAAGNLYFSDSFQGAIFRIEGATTCSAPCAVATVSHDPLLATAGFPPFGANGMAFSADGKTLYVANTGDNRVLAMNVATRAVSVFAESVHGADGLLFDRSTGLLWAAANQGDELVALNGNGRAVLKVGDFEGISRDGMPRGFLFPASMVSVDGFMYVTNTALPLTPAAGDEPEEDVTRWNIVRLRIGR